MLGRLETLDAVGRNITDREVLILSKSVRMIKITDPQALIHDRNQVLRGKTEVCPEIST